MRLFWTICGFGWASLLGVATCSCAAAVVEKVNFIYILADDLGYGDLGCLGQRKIQTPHLDRMAAEGLLFTQHYAGGPVCGPSRACLMTGQSQAIGYIKGNPSGDWRKENLRPQDVTVAEILQRAGYETVCFGKWGLGPQGKSGYATRQGFDHFVGYDTHISAHNYYPKQLCSDDGKLALAEGEYSHDVFTRLALDYLAGEHDRPFFLYLAYTIPHSPFNPPDIEPYVDKDWPTSHKKYAAMVTRMDRDIGKILDSLQSSGLAERTLVIFSSDNGPQSSYEKRVNAMTRFFDSNGPLRGIKRDVLEGGVRVPMIAWQPGTIAPGRSEHVSGFQDILPTFCELAAAESPAEIDGISFAPVLRGAHDQQSQHDFLYWEFIRVHGNEAHGARQGMLDVANNVKAIRYGRNNPMVVYDLAEDLGESTDVGQQDPERTRLLRRRMDELRTESDLWPRSMLEEGWSPH